MDTFEQHVGLFLPAMAGHDSFETAVAYSTSCPAVAFAAIAFWPSGHSATPDTGRAKPQAVACNHFAA